MSCYPINRRSLLRQLGVPCALTAVAPLSVWAQKPATLPLARIVVGSGAGSVIDNLARRVSERLQGGYAQSVIVENRTGASGQLAVSYVKGAAPDGATLLLTPSPHMVLFPFTFQSLPYRPAVDLLPVSLGATFDLAFAVGPLVPTQVRTLKEFVQWCKAHPDKAQFGSPAAGSTPHFTGAMLARAENFALDHVAYRGPNPAVLDMVGGHIAAACAPLGDLQTFAKTGKCRVLGTTGRKRSTFTPGTATFLEQGYSDVVIEDWVGFFLPAKTPAALVQWAQEDIARALSIHELKEAMASSCYEVVSSTPDALAARMAEEAARWKGVVTALGFTAMS
ncbi:tripartite tricarboxylate transporter substrate-binding protein [Pseudorhodoferax sp. Leaf265]|uniref:tripartite tricarboxylate transporter substrate-binding protein n=1 Tax=Pseudorhodoferax sp. Leaf265 TaxID=1736315 RepID=UPI00070239B5|nr:tripartite tricarboxylate transporter substrate-binding protein [Pseudorhodoferax sp. Leaf265]KQP04232.1 hypothetical protein ASF45_12720 [Pseudorhodoferax sp. Leaf265]